MYDNIIHEKRMSMEFLCMKKYFSNRFKCLRNAHLLSSSQCAYFLGFKSVGSIANLESGKFLPYLENLCEISRLFGGISLDWIVGNTNVPYTSESVSAAEMAVWDNILPTFDNLEWMAYLNTLEIPSDYFHNASRIKKYSLPVRANILFLLSVAYKITLSSKSQKEALTFEKKLYKTYSLSVEHLTRKILITKKVVFDLSTQAIIQNEYDLEPILTDTIDLIVCDEEDDG